MIGVRGIAADAIGSVGSTFEVAIPLESRMWDDVMPDVRASVKTL